MTDEAPTIGLRQVLGGVNLRDFARMVRGEMALVISSAQQAVEERRVLLPVVLLVALARFVLLALVVVVFGGAILLVTLVRGAARLLRGPRSDAG